ncbi:MAG: hypothetical protein EP343_08595 [Deltaproteobacteria bacterium]|nr:MAG: hypothetical protein EP343_08595 [Deltaproteobacteria bacterium]
MLGRRFVSSVVSVVLCGLMLGWGLSYQGCSGGSNQESTAESVTDAGSNPEAPAEGSSLQEFRIMTLNIPFFPGEINMGNHEERLKRLTELLQTAEESPHVVVLQEIWLDTMKQRIADNLKKEYPHSYLDTAQLEGLNSGLMMLSKFPIQKSGTFHYSDSFGAAETLAKKGVLGGRLELPGNKLIYVFTTHLQSSSKDEANAVKLKQLAEAKTFMETMSKDDNAPVVLAGDFNLSVEKNPETLAKAKALFPYVRDIHNPPAGKEVGGSTWGGLQGTGFLQRIDHIWILRGENVKAYSYISKIVDDKLSGHLAVFGHFDVSSW